MSGRARANGEGSIFPYRNGYAAYCWVRTPNGLRKKKWVYGRTREQVHDKWIELQGKARHGVVATSTPTVAEYLTYWLDEIIKPNRAPLTYQTYETFVRVHIVPGLGTKRLDRLRVRDVQTSPCVSRSASQLLHVAALDSFSQTSKSVAFTDLFTAFGPATGLRRPTGRACSCT